MAIVARPRDDASESENRASHSARTTASTSDLGSWPAVVACIVFVAAFALYLKTLAPAVGPNDSGELTSAIWCLGNAHPPGFPLFLLLTHVFTWLPIGTIAVRANIGTAFFGALACAMVAVAAGEILLMPRDLPALKAVPEERKSKKKQRIAQRVAQSSEKLEAGNSDLVQPYAVRKSKIVLALIMLLCGLLFAVSRTLWQYAPVTEVYALNTALMAGVAWGMLRWTRTGNVRWLYIAALLFGLGLSVHHVTIGTGAIAIAVLITRVAGIRFWRSRTTVIAGLLLASGLLVYLYLPIAAARKPVMNWGDPSTPSAIWDHVSGKQYRSYITTSEENDTAQFGRYLALIEREFGPPWLPIVPLIALAGIVLLYFRQRTVFWYILLSALANAAWFAIYPIANDGPAYAIPTYVVLTFAFAYGVSAILDLLKTERARIIATSALVILPLIELVTTYPIRDRSRYWVSHDYAENALRAMRPNALMITGDWQLYSPMRYALDVEHERPDIEAIHLGFVMRRWYFNDLARRSPLTVQGSRSEIDRFTAFVHQSEIDRAHVDLDAFNRSIDDLIISLIAHHIPRGPVYITSEIAASSSPRDVSLRKRIGEQWDIVPRGILIELMPGTHKLHDLPPVPIEVRGVADGTIEYEDDDGVPTEIIPAYRTMFVITGRYLAIAKKYAEALPAYRSALALDPANASIEREMREVESRAGQ